MRLRSLALFLSLALSLGTGLAGQSVEDTHNELRKLKADIVAAANKKDFATLLDRMHPNVVITWQDAQVCRGRAGVEAYMRRMSEGPGALVESFRTDPTVDELTILYGDTGIAFGSSTDEFKLRGRMHFTQKSRWTATMVKQDGKWLLASLHASVDVFDNPLLSAAKKSGYAFGIGGLVVGLVIGWLVARRK